MENYSLDPTGRLSLRLNRSVDHIIYEAKKKSRCPFHYWDAGIRYKGEILACLSCNISLCTNFYALLTIVQDLNYMKHIIINDILNDIERSGRSILIKSYSE